MTERPRPLVTVSHAASPDVREVYRRELGAHADLCFLEDEDAARHAQVLRRTDVLATFFADSELAAAELPCLEAPRFVQCLAAGRDRFPFERFPNARVAFNPGAAAGPVAEHAVALVLAGAKRVRRNHERMAEGAFDQHRQSLRLRGSTVAILGLGSIGREVAALLRPFGARLVGVNRSGQGHGVVDACHTPASLEPVLAGADVLVVCLELNPQTEGLLAAAQLACMKPDAILVNIGRAGVLVEEDLYRHLREHPAFTACLDVWWKEPRFDGAFGTTHPFLELPNVIGSPHVAGQVPGIFRDLAIAAVRRMRAELGWT